LRTNRHPRHGDDDDEWYEDEHRDPHVGSAIGAPGPADEEPDDDALGGLHGWLYYPDPSSRTGWSAWDVKRRRGDKPSPTGPIGFTIRRTTRGDPG
jgi:hypothetical protein